MAAQPSLQDFIDDELLRVPMTLDLVIDAVQQRWRQRLPASARGAGGDPARVLQMHRRELTARALAVLRASAQDDLQDLLPARAPSAASSAAPAARPGAGSDRAALSLIDEDDVAVDIEIARCVQTVKLQAEIVLRELQTYTSALVNDPNVARDTNPFRPERMVRALWQGVQVLPMPRALMAAFLGDAAQPLASTLQRAYGAACRRLEDQGVTPASHRTIVSTGHTTWGQTSGRYQVPEGLRGLRDSFGVAPAVPAPPAAAPRPAPENDAAAAAAGAPDPALIELLARLFEAIQTDFHLAPDTVALMQRLQPTALRVALRDPSLLDRYDHALWRFMDQLAHDLTLAAPSQRLRLLGLGRNLVDHLAASDLRDSRGFAWALERLLAAQRHALAQATAAAQPVIERLERIGADAASASTQGMPLDIANLDTVPAALLPEEAPAPAGLLAAVGLPPGATLRAYLQGERRTLVSLWQDREHTLALLREPATGQLFAVHQRAIAQLQAEGLAFPYKVRSLVRRSADKVLRGM